MTVVDTTIVDSPVNVDGTKVTISVGTTSVTGYTKAGVCQFKSSASLLFIVGTALTITTQDQSGTLQSGSGSKSIASLADSTTISVKSEFVVQLTLKDSLNSSLLPDI